MLSWGADDLGQARLALLGLTGRPGAAPALSRAGVGAPGARLCCVLAGATTDTASQPIRKLTGGWTAHYYTLQLIMFLGMLKLCTDWQAQCSQLVQETTVRNLHHLSPSPHPKCWATSEVKKAYPQQVTESKLCFWLHPFPADFILSPNLS